MRTIRNLLNPRVWAFLFGAALLAPAAQAACTYTLSPVDRNHGYGATNNMFQVLTGTGCVWSVTNPNSWITIQSGSSGTNMGTVAYSVTANPTINSRTGLVTVAGQTFTLSQDGLPCNYSVSPTTRNHGSAGISNNPSFTVSSLTGCAWSVTTTSSWIFFTGITTSSGTNGVTYAVAASHIPVSRTGMVVVANQLFTLTQSAAPCIYDVHIPNSALTNRLHGYGGSTGLVSVEVTSGQQNCDWFVVNSNTWISIIANPSGNGTGTFTYDVAPNPDAISRSGYLTVWNKAFYVLQNPAPCSVSFTPTSATTGADPETNTVLMTLAGGCLWGVTNTNSWISILPLTNNSGSGSFTYVTTGNAASLGRTGTVSVFDTNFFVIRQGAANCTYRLSPTNRVHGYGATTNTVNLSTLSVCPWTVVKTSSWVAVLSPTNGLGDSTISYALSQNSGAGDRTSVVLIGGQPFILTQHGIGCAINLSPSTRNHGYGGSPSNAVIVNTGAGCAWDVFTTNSWITILSSTNGVGSNIVSYAVAANPAALVRTGYLFIEDQKVTLIQTSAPCLYTLTPPSFLHSASQETGTVRVVSPVGCNWTVVNTNPWVTLLSSPNGTGSNSVTYYVATNLNPSARSGVLNIGGEAYSVIQDGVICSYKIAPTNRTHGYAATNNFWTMTVSNPCPWSVVNTNSWITILSATNGVGTGVVNYAVSANTSSTSDRVGAVVIGGQVSLITQHGLGCNYNLSPTNRNHGFSGNTSAPVNITAGAGCSWHIVNTNDWITILTATNGSGNSSFTYSFQPNFGNAARTGTITLEDETLVISQTPATGGFSFESISYGPTGDVTLRLVGGPAGSWEIQRSADLASWTKVADITNTTGRVEKTLPGPAGNSRFFRAVLQSGLACTYSLTPATRAHGFGATSNSFTVNTGNGCFWSVTNTSPWVQIVSGSNGTTSGPVGYTVSANLTLVERIAQLTVAGQTFIITQAPSTCAINLTPDSRNHGYGAATSAVSVATALGCPWAVSNTNSWISIVPGWSGSGTGTVTYTLASNLSFNVRSGNVTIGDQNFFISQAAYLCNYKLSPTNRSHGFGATTGMVSITAGPTCSWALINTNGWITITTPTTGFGNSNFTYTIQPNFGAATRTGSITMEGETLILSQSPATGGFAFESIVYGLAGDVTVRLAGGPAGIWEIQRSGDLTNWVRVADITNTTGRVEKNIPGPASTNRFFRARLP